MAFSSLGFSKTKGSANADAYLNAAAPHFYKSTEDTLATIISDGYFNDVADLLTAGDMLYASGTDGATIVFVNAVSPNVTIGQITDAAIKQQYALSLEVDFGVVGAFQMPAYPLAPGSTIIAQLNAIKATGNVLSTGNVTFEVRKNATTVINTINIASGNIGPGSIYDETAVNVTQFNGGDIIDVNVTTANPVSCPGVVTFGFAEV